MNVRVALAACLLCCAQARAAADFVVQTTPAADEKAVFATVESTETVPARVRTAGTIAALAVRRGDEVRQGQLIATVGDPKLVLQEAGLRDEIAALHAQLAQTKADLQRSETLVLTGATPRMLRDQLRTQVQVQQNTIQARMAQLQVVAQQMTEGQVLAPTSGRVLDLPYTEGTVVTAGESVASIAVSGYVLRLRVPEEHARFIKPGDQIRVDDAALPGGGSATGRITLVYPQIKDGRVVAEAQVAGLGAYFVGQRVLVWVAGGVRPRVVVPANLLVTRFGLDYARLVAPGGIVEVPVQRGQPANLPNMPDGIEILSGLCAGDRLAPP
jgi:RND family efflux transporter MFP subunit